MQRENEIVEALGASLRKRSQALRTQVPVHVERNIRMALSELDNRPETQPWYSMFWNWLSRPSVALSLGGGVAVLLVAVFMYNRASQSQLSTEITTAALETFHKVHRNHEPLDVTTKNPAAVKSYLRDKGFRNEVFFPEIDADLAGARVFYINEHPCVELVYHRGEHTIALLEVEDHYIEEGQVQMDSVVQQDVDQSRWHWAATEENGTLFVWKSNSIMCTVVSDLQIEQTSALFRLEAL